MGDAKKHQSLTPGRELDIQIDYDHIDVAQIMEAVKSHAASSSTIRPEERKGERSGPELTFPAEPTSRRSKIKHLLLKLMTPFAPLIKLLILPVYEEQRQIFLSLHETNKRLDALTARLDAETEKASRSREYIKLLHHLAHNIVVEMSKLKIEEETLKTKTRMIERDFETLARREREVEKEVFK